MTTISKEEMIDSFWDNQLDANLTNKQVQDAYRTIMKSEANEFLTDDQCKNLFVCILKGGSDLTIDLLDRLFKEYSINETDTNVDIVSMLVKRLHNLMKKNKPQNYLINYKHERNIL